MDVSYIYFDKLELNDKNRFYLDFSSNSQLTNTILISLEKDYFITSMFCPLDIKPGINKSAKKYKEIKELSHFGKELELNGSNVFFNIEEVSLKSDALGYKELFEKTFKLVTDKQKLFNYEFNYFNLDEDKIKKAAICRPYDHLQARGFTFENKIEKET